MIGFDDDGNVMGGSFGGNLADAAVGTAGAMEGATASEGLGEISGGPGLSAAQVNAVPTMSVVPDKSLPKQVTSFTNALKAAMNLTPTRMAMSLLARTGDLTPTMSFMADDPRAMNAPVTTAGIPGYLGQNYGVGTITDVAMSGSGAHMAPATSIQNWGGQDVHVGPGYQMNMAGIEDGFFPGYGVNPYSGVAMADPSDPYIRKNRGSEIVAMIGA